MPYRVLHLLGTARLEWTGICRSVAALVRNLDRDRFTCEAWFLDGGGPLETMLRDAGLPVRVFQWTGGARQPGAAWDFWQELRREKFDLIHAHFGGRSVRWLARSANGAPVVFQVSARVLEARGLEPAAIPCTGADVVIAISQAVARIVSHPDVRVVYPGVAIRPEAPVRGGDSVVIGAAGRLVKLKGYDHLLRAFAALSREFPALRLEIAGLGEEQPALENLARSLGIAGRVTFPGWQDDLVPAFSRWHIFAHPSLEDGLSISVLEAQAHGIPAVASRVGGVPEAIADGETGLLVPPGDAEAFAAALRRLAADPVLRLRMGAAARRRAIEKFSDQRSASEVAAIYDELISRRKRG